MTKANEDRLNRIEKMLAGLGDAVNTLAGRTMQGRTLLRVGREHTNGEDPNFIGHGTPEHATLLGLVEVITDEDKAEAEAAFVTYEDPRDGRIWRTYDEEAPLRWYPGIEPEKAIRRVIIQKLNVFNAGQPEAPPNTQGMWSPGGSEALTYLNLPRDGSVEVVDNGDEKVTVFEFPWQPIV